jgi:membrane protease YdiL (CAAX protease family)
MAVLKHGIRAVPGAAGVLATIAVAVQLYVPLLRARRGDVDYETLGLRLDRWRVDLAALVIAIVLVTPPYFFGFGWWVPWADTFEWKLPPDFAQRFFLETLVVAFAEELFFRGYLQDRWTRGDPRGWRVAGVAWRPIVAVSAVFALIHFVGEYNPARLAPFFPSLLFGLLRAKTGSIVAATGFHAYCNALADVMFYGYS